ncbi:MAG: cytochrome bd-I oxidase subunit CydX, partial [Gammaproteobacteria bacterium]
MWYFAWILGVLLACAFGIINVLWLEAQEALDQQATVLDPLTKLPNRVEFLTKMEDFIDRQILEPQPFSLLMIGLDAFHPVLEACGDEGVDDLVLKISNIIDKETRRPIDTVSRYDAETFAVLMPGANRAIAEATAKRIQEGSSGQVDPAAGCASVLSIGIVECLG